MNRFIYFSDSHYNFKTPISRKDNYSDSILRKLEFTFKLARKNNAIILMGGDLFDTPKLKVFDFMPLLKLFDQYRGIEKYSLIGNESHDGVGDASPMSILLMTGMIHPSIQYQTFENTRIIFGHHGCDFKELNRLIHPDKYNIMMTHTTLVKEPVIFQHELIEDFETTANMICVAHYHPYQGIIKRSDGVVFVAPGAMARRKRVAHDIGRTPKCVYIVIGDDNKLKGTKEIDLPCDQDIWTEKSGLDSLDSSWYNESSVGSVEKMKSEIDSEVLFASLSDYIKRYATANNTKPEVLANALEMIK